MKDRYKHLGAVDSLQQSAAAFDYTYGSFHCITLCGCIRTPNNLHRDTENSGYGRVMGGSTGSSRRRACHGGRTGVTFHLSHFWGNRINRTSEVRIHPQFFASERTQRARQVGAMGPVHPPGWPGPPVLCPNVLANGQRAGLARLRTLAATGLSSPCPNGAHLPQRQISREKVPAGQGRKPRQSKESTRQGNHSSAEGYPLAWGQVPVRYPRQVPTQHAAGLPSPIDGDRRSASR